MWRISSDEDFTHILHKKLPWLANKNAEGGEEWMGCNSWRPAGIRVEGLHFVSFWSSVTARKLLLHISSALKKPHKGRTVEWCQWSSARLLLGGTWARAATVALLQNFDHRAVEYSKVRIVWFKYSSKSRLDCWWMVMCSTEASSLLPDKWIIS